MKNLHPYILVLLIEIKHNPRGSTSLPKGVVLRHYQVLANVGAMLDKVVYDKTDHMVSWLPIHHDMGLGAVTIDATGT